MSLPSFSVVCIARNESKTLPRLVASLKEFQELGGEICIVDTGSTDGTPDIARLLGCTVTEVGDRFRKRIDADLSTQINTHFIQEGEAPVVNPGDSLFDFAEARNFAASLASNDMIAMPDCDEVFTKLDLAKLNQAILDGAEQLEYNFVFAHDQFGKPTISFLHSKFYNRTKLKWVGVIHEVLSGEANRVFLPEDAILLEHFQNQETNRGGYLKGLALDCFEHPDSDRNSHYFAREMLYTGRHKSAIKEFERHIAMNRWEAERGQSWVYIGECYMCLGNEAEAVKAWQQAFTVCGDRREPFIRLAEYYQKKNDAKRTLAYASAALALPRGNFYSDNAAHYAHSPHELAYWALWYLGSKEESKKHFELAFGYQPENPKYLHDARFYLDLPTISVIIPHLSMGFEERERGLERCLASIKTQNYPQELVEVIVLDGEGTVPEKVKTGVERSSSEFIVYASNDMEFDSNAFIFAVLDARKQNKQLVSLNSGEVLPDQGNICEHFLINRWLLPLIGGEVFDTRLHHVGVDNLLWARASKLDQAVHSERAKATHYHFSKGSDFDAVYKKGWEHVEADRALLKELLTQI